MSPFRFAFHIGWTRDNVQMTGNWKRIVGPIWISVQW